MTEHEPADELPQRCRAVVERVLTRYGWRLLAPEEFVRQMVECVNNHEVVELWPAAIHVYCRCLYTACLGDDEKERQEIGFTELQRYLYELSFREIADLPSDLRYDAVNETLLRIWEKRTIYRKPGAFLAIAAFELRNVLRPWWSRPELFQPLDNAVEIATAANDDPIIHAFTSEVQQRVRICFEETLRHHPHAKQQLEAFWLKHYAGFDDDTIGKYFGKSSGAVHTLRSRGRSHLRAEPCWQQLAQDLGLADDKAEI